MSNKTMDKKINPLDKVIHYQNFIKQILTEYQKISPQVPVPDVDEVFMN